jgi:hypothetical protein
MSQTALSAVPQFLPSCHLPEKDYFRTYFRTDHCGKAELQFFRQDAKCETFWKKKLDCDQAEG